MKHCMVDLETFGLAPGSALRSIGAVMFDPFRHCVMGETFYRNIDKDSCVSWGMTINPDTEAWWAKQTVEARSALESAKVGLSIALESFRQWWGQQGAEFIWAHGANFDPVLLASAYDAIGEKEPWHYRAVRDTRTVYWLGGVEVETLDRTGPKHHALHDAINQARAVQIAIEKMRLGYPSIPLVEAA